MKPWGSTWKSVVTRAEPSEASMTQRPDGLKRWVGSSASFSGANQAHVHGGDRGPGGVKAISPSRNGSVWTKGSSASRAVSHV